MYCRLGSTTVEVFESLEVSEEFPPGWYWWACSPGCLPDGDPSGPFETEDGAYKDAQEYCEEGEE